MKTKFLALLLVLLLGIFSMIACGGAGTGGGEGSGEGTGEGTGTGTGTADPAYRKYLFYKGEVTPTVVYNFGNNAVVQGAATIVSALSSQLGTNVPYNTDQMEEVEHEIVIGPTNRAISQKAYRKLQAAQRNNEYHVAYVIYASRNNVAIAYDESFDYIGAEVACEYFVENYVTETDSVELTSGVVAEKSFSALDYYREIDNVKFAEYWSALEEQAGEEYGKEIVEAFQYWYGKYDHDVVTWLANLYDPAIGGFYYSNSARDNNGYAPDTESTSQALGMVGNIGKSAGLGWTSVLSQETKDQILTYIKSLQDPDGYFYNYQWEKSETRLRPSRMNRDLNWCNSMLSSLGAKPTYNTPNGVEGDGVVVIGPYATTEETEPTSLVELTTPFGTGSVATAVSKVVLVSTYDQHFQSMETLNAYLAGLEKSGRSFYSIGNEITSGMSQVNARDKVLAKEFADDPANEGKTYYRLADRIIEWFNSHQNPANGLWGLNGNATANYLGVNGLLKISGIYNSANREIPYAEKAAESAIAAISSDESMGAVVDLYNTWFSVSNVLGNLRKYGTTQTIDGVEMNGAARADKIMMDLRAIAPAAIRKSADKIMDFAKPDGSFSYTKSASSSTSQGMPVAVPGTNEGDVNATVISITGTIGNAFSALGLSMVPFYTLEDLCIFKHVFNDLGPVIKPEVVEIADEPINFEDEEVGETVTSISCGTMTNIIKEEPVEGSELSNYYANVIGAKGTGQTVTVNNNGKKDGSCQVFSAKFRINSSGTGGGYLLQVTMGSSYMFSVHVSGSTVTIKENTTTSSSTSRETTLTSVKIDEWFTIRIEYYKNGYEGEQRAVIYVNDKVVGVTNGFYQMQKDGSGTPAQGNLTNTKIYKMMSLALNMDIDDVYCGTTNKIYTVVTDPSLTVNCDKDVKPATPVE